VFNPVDTVAQQRLLEFRLRLIPLESSEPGFSLLGLCFGEAFHFWR